MYNYSFTAITCFTQVQTMEYKCSLGHCVVSTYGDTYGTYGRWPWGLYIKTSICIRIPQFPRISKLSLAPTQV